MRLKGCFTSRALQTHPNPTFAFMDYLQLVNGLPG
ncbi:hypothetical protein PDTA9759_17320 [Phytobacter diazotrophicus]|uniref:Uncharacterized protein n=1 Tax=Phytobacter diazotrophicus TaxID=395631 RepID=A0ABN6LM28_9ENTR|nr:hypothetical protein PDTA9734_17320 [Phytobacter diazotrophicus]BEG81273.1 hypothetical protein PDTA9730_17290 [Phytobacter diazotrophicus]BEG87076.1 hypothetical protein PDTA9759_17320 [Phytobacter diazotrophicus]BEG92870.1 hypothetical protein PDTA9832_17290 [Phytobacter diazotrophicus]